MMLRLSMLLILFYYSTKEITKRSICYVVPSYKAIYTANTSGGWVGRGRNASFCTFSNR